MTGEQLRAAVARSNLTGDEAAALLGVARGRLYAYYKQPLLEEKVAARVIDRFGIHLRSAEGGYFDHYDDQDLLEELGRRLKAYRYPERSEATQPLRVVPDADRPEDESKGGHRNKGTGGPPD